MKNIFKLLLIFTLILSFSQSVFAKNYEDRLMERRYRKALIAGCEHIKAKNPKTAAILGILPGGGSFYTGAYVLGTFDIVFWICGSTLWDAPLAWHRAKKINMEETVFYCELEGKKL